MSHDASSTNLCFTQALSLSTVRTQHSVSSRHSHCTVAPRHRSPVTLNLSPGEQPSASACLTRRTFVLSLISAIATGASCAEAIAAGDADPTPTPTPTELGEVQQANNGVTYVDFATGEGRTPKWGDYVTFHYTLYTINPTTKELVKHDTSYGRMKKGFLVHHGNGEAILGLEQMLHSMNPGSKRRFVLPPRLAYFKAGFIPIPPGARQRRKFSKALEETGGLVVMDVEMLSIQNDPDESRGYYTDATPTEQELIDKIAEFKVREEDIEPDAIRIEI